MTTTADLLDIDSEDVAHMRKVRRREYLGPVLRYFAYAAAAFVGMVTGVIAVSNGRLTYPYAIPAAALAGADLRPRWKTPVLLAVSFMIGFAVMAIGGAEGSFGEGSYYGTYSRTTRRETS